MRPFRVNKQCHTRQLAKSRAFCVFRSASFTSFTSSTSFTSPISGFPYPLPSSVLCNSFVCHSYENCRVCTQNSHSGTHPPLRIHLCFHALTWDSFCKPFVFKFMHVMGGVYESVWQLQVVATNCARPTTLSQYVVVATNKNRVPTQTRVPPHLTLPLPRRSFITIHFPLPTIPLSFRETFLPPLSYLSPRTGPSAGQEASSHVRP